MSNYYATLKVDVIEILNTLPHSLGFVTRFFGRFCNKTNCSKNWFDALEKHGEKTTRNTQRGWNRVWPSRLSSLPLQRHSGCGVTAFVGVVLCKAWFPCFCLFWREGENSPGKDRKGGHDRRLCVSQHQRLLFWVLFVFMSRHPQHRDRSNHFRPRKNNT